MSDSIRIRLSVGLIVVAVLHAILLGLVFTALHTPSTDSQPTGVWQVPAYHPEIAIGSGAIEKLAEPPVINLEAQGEMKQAGPLFSRLRRTWTSSSRPACQPVQVDFQRLTTYSTPAATVSHPRVETTGVAVVKTTEATGKTKEAPQACETQCNVQQKLAANTAAAPSLLLLPENTPTKAGPAQPTPTKDYQIALFVGNDGQSKKLIEWFDQDPQLKDLRASCDFQVYTATNALYRTRFADIVPSDQFPVVLFQDATGGHIHAAGRSMIPETAQQLYSDLSYGYQLYQQAMQAQKTGAIKARGYSWDDSIKPTMSLFGEDCPDDVCPTEPSNRWRPGGRVRDTLFDNVTTRRDALIWASAQEVATIVLSLIAVVLVGFILIKRGM